MTDETDDDDRFDADEIREEAAQPFTGGGMGFFSTIFGGSEFGADVDETPTEELALAIRLLKAGEALHDVAEFLDEHDIDITELGPAEMQDLDRGEKQVVFGVSAMSGSMEEFASIIDDDDSDDSNPFKVSDGDDPVY